MCDPHQRLQIDLGSAINVPKNAPEAYNTIYMVNLIKLERWWTHFSHFSTVRTNNTKKMWRKMKEFASGQKTTRRTYLSACPRMKKSSSLMITAAAFRRRVLRHSFTFFHQRGGGERWWWWVPKKHDLSQFYGPIKVELFFNLVRQSVKIKDN